MLGLALDLSLITIALWVAWRSLSHSDLLVSVVLFIVFGLLMSLIWARLAAEDIALAEATIGAGLTGALLLDAMSRPPFGVRNGAVVRRSPPASETRLDPRYITRGSALLSLALGTFLAVVVIRLDRAPGGLTAPVTANLARSGVDHPTTAVLLFFRGYDTLLEMGVLLLAGLGMLVSRGARDLSLPEDARGDLMLRWLVKLLLPILVLSAAHLLLLGTRQAGGGFQAGALLAATAVLLLLAGHRSVRAVRGLWFRVALLSGFAFFLIAAVVPLLAGGSFLGFPSEIALAVEAGIALSTAFTLAALFAGARSRQEHIHR